MAAPALETFMERAGCGVGGWEWWGEWRDVRSLAKTLGGEGSGGEVPQWWNSAQI